ncbi:MAG: 7-carboxy-7-deazaguanine synthase QueE [Woeseiaceae bacterium]
MVTATVAAPRVGQRLRITEIFRSLQGEALTAGLPTVFVRLTGCPLRCQYCDSAYAFSGGQSMVLGDIVDQVTAMQTRRVCVTGGEPLAQAGCHELLTRFCDLGLDVSLETSGAIDVTDVDSRVSRVVDIKTPGSLEEGKNLWSNLDVLDSSDQVKFVICDRADFDWALEMIEKHAMLERCTVWVSPSFEQVELSDLAAWVLDSGIDVRLQTQLHKLLWGDTPGR